MIISIKDNLRGTEMHSGGRHKSSVWHSAKDRWCFVAEHTRGLFVLSSLELGISAAQCDCIRTTLTIVVITLQIALHQQWVSEVIFRELCHASAVCPAGPLHHLELLLDWAHQLFNSNCNWAALGLWAVIPGCHGLWGVVLSYSAWGDTHHSASRSGVIIVNSAGPRQTTALLSSMELVVLFSWERAELS